MVVKGVASVQKESAARRRRPQWRKQVRWKHEHKGLSELSQAKMKLASKLEAGGAAREWLAAGKVVGKKGRPLARSNARRSGLGRPAIPRPATSHPAWYLDHTYSTKSGRSNRGNQSRGAILVQKTLSIPFLGALRMSMLPQW